MISNSNTPQTQTTSAWSVISLISAISGYFILPIFGAITAIITGYVAKREIKQSGGRMIGKGMANAGLILGWISIISAIILSIVVLLMVFGVIAGASNWGPYSDWMNQFR